MTEPGQTGPSLLTRRNVILAGAGAAVALALLPLALRTLEQRIRTILAAHFGEEIASEPAARQFAADLARDITDADGGLRRRIALLGAARVPGGPLFDRARSEIETTAVTQFLKRTNAYRRHLGVDDALLYLSLDPYATGCGNFLSATFAP